MTITPDKEHVPDTAPEDGYRELAADAEREEETQAWVNGLAVSPAHRPGR